jgi:GTPase SAR1 family protein
LLTNIPHSYDALEPWLDALQAANARRGSAPLPVIVVGTKIDLLSSRTVKPVEVELPHVKKLPYLEISSKGNYKTKELLLGVVRALLG